MINIWVFVGMGSAGSVSQRQTLLGLLHFEQMGRRGCAGSNSGSVVVCVCMSGFSLSAFDIILNPLRFGCLLTKTVLFLRL